MQIQNKSIGKDQPCFIVAEISGNHHQNFETAVALVQAAAEAGADAVKAQTYTPDTLTFDSDKEWFRVRGKMQPDTWKGRSLYDLYREAYTPWEWLPKLKKITQDHGLLFFTSVFDESSVDYNEEMNVPVYKIASYEVIHLPLLKKVASTGKPVILSIGFASRDEVDAAIGTLRNHGAGDLAVLHCVTTYSEKPVMEQSNLETIRDIAARYDVVSGFSDNTGGIQIPILAAAAAGASIIEKHLILDRDAGGPDARFSIDPKEFREMVRTIRKIEGDPTLLKTFVNAEELRKAIGITRYGVGNEKEAENLLFRPSLWVGKKMAVGEKFSQDNIRVARPNTGLSPLDYDRVMGRIAAKEIDAITPLSRDLIAGDFL